MISHDVELPAGWDALRAGDRLLVAERTRLASLIERGLDRPEGWERLLAAGRSSGGRGGSARVEIVPGLVARLKPLLRGGLVARLRPDLFSGLSRPAANVRLPLEAARRGIRTPAPIALCCRRRRAGWQAWLALHEVDGGEDLGRALERHGAAAIDLDALTAAIRSAHDAGLEHRDLNVGNLLLVPGRGASCVVWLLDLDGARLHAGPLGFGLRRRALRRLERSLVKTGAAGESTALLRERLYTSYAAGDDVLGRRLRRGRAIGRALIRLHAAGWRRGR